MEVDWQKTLKYWIPSETAVRVTDKNEILAIVALLNEFAEEKIDRITHWEKNPIKLLDAYKQLQADWPGNDQLLLAAATQLSEHGYVWETHLDEGATMIKTYEMPVAIMHNRKLNYFKFQFDNSANSLYTPTSLNSISIRYHLPNKPNKGVIYV